ncbi:MAG: 2OG-Fe(II) oxygenase [Gammaproteobacteria bacterium]|nr:2OG-Fe(II) oxygenase [Gammaproteobacteria bacterium]
MDIDIGYNMDNSPLETLLLSISRPGDFYAHGRLFAPMPKLEVDNVGVLSFPVTEAQVRALINTAERAPYGKGTDTLVDTTVRDCWQIDGMSIDIGGAMWDDTFSRILIAAATDLGCRAERLEAELYKLLIYEPGGFFASHRDTEKTRGMIATLTISLPTVGVGGELSVRHQDREIVIDMNANEPSELVFAAFYADCTHETKPVRKGHRLSLVFNLCLHQDDTETPRQAPDHIDEVESIVQQLVHWRDSEQSSDKLVWLLEHDYSEAGLSFDTLKNTDDAWARVLGMATDRAECEMYAAIVHIKEEGEALYPDGDYVDSWYWRENEVDDMEIGEVFDGSYWLDNWSGRDGSRPPLQMIPLYAQELLPVGALDDAEPDEQWLHEASGNEGVSLERAYRHAAFVIWPRSKTLDILAEAQIGSAVAWVAEQLECNGGVADEQVSALVLRLIDIWPSGPRDHKAQSRIDMLHLLTAVEDETLTVRFLRQVVLLHYNGDENEALLAALGEIPMDAIGEFLVDLIRARFVIRTDATLAFLRGVGESMSTARNDVLEVSVRTALSLLPESMEKRIEDDKWNSESEETISDQAVCDLFTLAWRCDLMDDAETAALAITDYPLAVTPDRTIPAALGELYSETGLADTAAYTNLWRHATEFLLTRSELPPEQPLDWRITADINCHCEYCTKLRAFCKDPSTQIARFPLRKDLRAHLHKIIDYNQLDLTHETERRGRPYTLVCTKTRATYRRRLAEYTEDVSCMRLLIRFAPGGQWVKFCTTGLARLQQAVTAAHGM